MYIPVFKSPVICPVSIVSYSTCRYDLRYSSCILRNDQYSVLKVYTHTFSVERENVDMVIDNYFEKALGIKDTDVDGKKYFKHSCNT
jgi:hypothetical protein